MSALEWGNTAFESLHLPKTRFNRLLLGEKSNFEHIMDGIQQPHAYVLRLTPTLLARVLSYIDKRQDKEAVRLTCKAFAAAMLPSLRSIAWLSPYNMAFRELEDLASFENVAAEISALICAGATLDPIYVGCRDMWEKHWNFSCTEWKFLHQDDNENTKWDTYNEYCSLCTHMVKNVPARVQQLSMPLGRMRNIKTLAFMDDHRWSDGRMPTARTTLLSTDMYDSLSPYFLFMIVIIAASQLQLEIEDLHIQPSGLETSDM